MSVLYPSNVLLHSKYFEVGQGHTIR